MPRSQDTRRHPVKTLDRILSKAGIGSRREARSWIGAGRVTVNGKTIQTPDFWVDPARDNVALDGRPLERKRKRYLLLYKPKNYLTTYRDPEGRPTIYDLLTDVEDFLVPVGRLDQDTTGLLLLTNDTAFADYVTSPLSKVPKTYLVKASQILTEAQLDQLRQGLTLADGPTRPAIVNRQRDSGRYTFFEITITEGRNRQVRRMVETLGAKVLKLVRTQIGSLRIDDLQIGHYRELSPSEVAALAPVAAGSNSQIKAVNLSVRQPDQKRKQPFAPKRGKSPAKLHSGGKSLLFNRSLPGATVK